MITEDEQKASLNLASGSLVYCVLFVMMSTNVEKKISFLRGGTCLDSLWFFSGRKLGQYADQELLKSLFQN